MVFIGSEALASGTLNRYQLRTQYDAVHRNVYVRRGTTLTPVDKAIAAWLWSGRRGVAAGLSAAAVHGSKWIDPALPAELNQTSRSGPAGIVIHSDELRPDEVTQVRGVDVTSLARTAFDLGRRKGLTTAVIRVDALLQVADLKIADIESLAVHHSGVRGVRQLRDVLDLADDGAESPQETRLRLLLTWADLRPTDTQINVYDEYALVGRLDMGYPEWKVGVQYDGAQHWTDPRQRALDIDQDARYRELGWRIVRVGAELLRYRTPTIIRRVRAELNAAGAPC
ncbi:endonuclease domain-containing protein [Mycolicibacterium bacteremicum]|uniref:endonuclease domain-containing protein n=1 Tax=Mycolicibacterium bacteremicum TaxID=564198 RepID=UPI0026ED6ABC|nr:hypothetical protein [Mycolicibacterium bacteremicum]